MFKLDRLSVAIRPIGAATHKRYSVSFDYDWYTTTYRDILVRDIGINRPLATCKEALAHYLRSGWRSGLNPSPYFDLAWYLEHNPSLRERNIEPLGHYLTEGWRKGASPSVYFNPRWYLSQNPDVARAEVEPLQHFLAFGWREGRSPNAYFDPQWYLDQNADVALSRMDPFRHYVMFGWREGRAPSIYFDPVAYYERNANTTRAEPLRDYLTRGWLEGRAISKYFDTQWYLDSYLVVRGLQTEPLLHYLSVGWRDGFSPNPWFSPREYCLRHPECLARGFEPLKHHLTRETRNQEVTGKAIAGGKRATAPLQARYFSLSLAPLVSIIIPNFNGARHLHELFASLAIQTYKNFEVIFVDDNSSDNSVEIAAQFGVKHIVESKKSLGFAEANNVALPFCSGELLALLNNDTRVDANWLESMVTTIRGDPLIAAVAPKIRFWTKFQLLRFESAYAFELDLPRLLESLAYKKYFSVWAHAPADSLRSKTTGSSNREELILHVSVQDEPINLHLRGLEGQAVELHVGMRTKSLVLVAGAIDIEYSFTDVDRKASYYIINNAGSALDATGNPYDRGFGFVDGGEFDTPADVELFCGGAVLLRRDALHGRELFISEFEAYYEDSELSRWLGQKGYRIVYNPMAVVYHKHASTTKENSLFWLKHTTRNKILYDYIYADKLSNAAILEQHRLHLNHLTHWAQSSLDAKEHDRQYALMIPEILRDIERIVPLIDNKETPRRSGLRIGVYNSYWRTLGGGEAHALDLTAALCRFGQVELIAEGDFDMAYMMEYFGHSNLNVRKRLISAFSPDLTHDYDIFVNSTYLSRAPSFAAKSFYVVSFPFREASAQFLSSYYFLANSSFTLDWMKTYWGANTFSGTVLYPTIPKAYAAIGSDKMLLKNKSILSVGRFVARGHTKNQLEIVEGFRAFIERYPRIARGWTLKLIGTVNDPEYLAQVLRASDGLDISITTDVDFNAVREAYFAARIYVHASGFGRDAQTEPELCEHFGIAVIQALSCGCIPVVFDSAGPKEIVEKVGVGCTWRTVDELVETLRETAEAFHDNGGDDLVGKAIESVAPFWPDQMNAMLERLIVNGDVMSGRRLPGKATLRAYDGS